MNAIDDCTYPGPADTRTPEKWGWKTQADGFYVSSPYRYEQELALDDALIEVEK